MLGVNLQTFPILGIIGGFLYSTYCYFYVILNGGVGKNGSTVAVSATQRCINVKMLNVQLATVNLTCYGLVQTVYVCNVLKGIVHPKTVDF